MLWTFVDCFPNFGFAENRPTNLHKKNKIRGNTILTKIHLSDSEALTYLDFELLDLLPTAAVDGATCKEDEEVAASRLSWELSREEIDHLHKYV